MSFGDNSHGQLGINSLSNKEYYPTIIKSLNNKIVLKIRFFFLLRK